MIVGVPKEIKDQEYRVGLTPASAREYVSHGHKVLVEAGAGAGISVSDDEYVSVGAEIAHSAAQVFAEADMIVKVKEPQLNECAMLREGQLLFTYLHLAPDRAQTEALLASGCTAIAYETVSLDDGSLPLLAPMSEVAGRLSVEAGAYSLKKFNGGSGVLIGGVPGVRPARIVIIGGGVVGLNAAQMAVGAGSEVTILDRSLPRLRELDQMFGGHVRTRYSTTEVIEEEISEADIVVGAVLIPGSSAPKLVSKQALSMMKPGSVLVDVAIDQGGCFETSKATTHADPIYDVDGIVHYCVANMPGSVPKTSTNALNNATLPYGLELADGGFEAVRNSSALMRGMNVHEGILTNASVGESLGMPYEVAANSS